MPLIVGPAGILKRESNWRLSHTVAGLDVERLCPPKPRPYVLEGCAGYRTVPMPNVKTQNPHTPVI